MSCAVSPMHKSNMSMHALDLWPLMSTPDHFPFLPAGTHIGGYTDIMSTDIMSDS